MVVALYPGSFDPIHNGHVAVITTAAGLFDEVVVAVGHNLAKPGGMFTPDQRMELIAEATKHLKAIRVVSFTGLVTKAAHDVGADCLVKGVRGSGDLDSEMLQAGMNYSTSGVPTLFVPAIGSEAMISSRYVREISAAGVDVSAVVPEVVAKRLAQRGVQQS